MTDPLVADAIAFARTVDARSRAGVELEGIVASGAVPISRDETWHAVASVLVVDVQGAILLARNGSGGWGTAGGHIESTDASIRAAATREAYEELGLVVDPAALTPLLFLPDTVAFRPGHAHWDFCYLHVVDGRLEVTAADDVTEAAWFDLDSLPGMNDHMRALVEAAVASR